MTWSLRALDPPDTMTAPVRPRTTVQGDTARRDRRTPRVERVIERAHHRRRASDLADERANRAAVRGDLVALWVASGQADAARQRRAEWAERHGSRERLTANATSGD
jgi:hypothetical protein